VESVGELPFGEQRRITWIGPQNIEERREPERAYVSMHFACAAQPLECPVEVAAGRINGGDRELVPMPGFELLQRSIRGVRLVECGARVRGADDGGIE
jgi:hypothetical protein